MFSCDCGGDRSFVKNMDSVNRRGATNLLQVVTPSNATAIRSNATNLAPPDGLNRPGGANPRRPPSNQSLALLRGCLSKRQGGPLGGWLRWQMARVSLQLSAGVSRSCAKPSAKTRPTIKLKRAWQFGGCRALPSPLCTTQPTPQAYALLLSLHDSSCVDPVQQCHGLGADVRQWHRRLAVSGLD